MKKVGHFRGARGSPPAVPSPAIATPSAGYAELPIFVSSTASTFPMNSGSTLALIAIALVVPDGRIIYAGGWNCYELTMVDICMFANAWVGRVA